MDVSKTKYEEVRLANEADHDDARSSTEVDESLLEFGKNWQNEEEPGRPRRRTKERTCFPKLRSFRWVIDTALLIIILGLLIKDHRRQSGSQENKYETGGDFTGVHPDLPHKVLRFQSDSSYAPTNTSEFFTEEVLQKWNDLMPKGMGFVWVNETHKYHDLPNPIEWPEKTVFTTSWTHQLHCLYAIVQTYSGITSGHEIPGDHHWHMIHCFDYMRNAIMCSADMALEGHATTFPDDNSGSDGWDATHVCRDMDQAKAYLESVRAYDDQLIY